MFFSWLPIGGLGAQDRSILQAKPPPLMKTWNFDTEF
jgi:hypothetical protein